MRNNIYQIKNSKIESFIYALLITLPTIAFIRVEFYLLFIPIILFKYKEYFSRIPELIKSNKNNKLLWFIIGIPILSFFNRLLHVDFSEEGIKGLYSFAYLLPLLYLIAKLTLSKDVIKYLTYFLAIEVGIGIFEFIIGQSSIFTNTPNYFKFTSYELLYNTRVFGLANNSSVLSEKILLGIILLDYIQLKYKRIFLVIFLIGLVITFNRTMLISYLAYLVFVLIYNLSYNNFDKLKSWFKTIGYIHFLFLSIWLISPNYSYNQFSRNNAEVTQGRVKNDQFSSDSELFTNMIEEGGIEMSGRGEIWDNFFTYLKANLAFGNGSKKLRIGKHHAHNSILEVLTSHGVIIGSLYLFMIIFSLTKQNLILIATCFIASLAQYFVFWGVSYFDIILMFFLIPNNILVYDT